MRYSHIQILSKIFKYISSTSALGQWQHTHSIKALAHSNKNKNNSSTKFQIQSTCCNQSQTQMLLNCSDRIVRLINVQTLSIVYEWSEPINRRPWTNCCFSMDGEVVITATVSSRSSSKYALYLWSSATGQLLDQLDSPGSNEVVSLSFHPLR